MADIVCQQSGTGHAKAYEILMPYLYYCFVVWHHCGHRSWRKLINAAYVLFSTIGSFTKPRRQRRGQRHLKNELIYFTYESRDTQRHILCLSLSKLSPT